jgi:hypothetical protein
LSQRSFAPIYNLGTVCRIHIGYKTSLLISADYYSTKLEFGEMQPGAKEQPIKALSLGFGIALRLK